MTRQTTKTSHRNPGAPRHIRKEKDMTLQHAHLNGGENKVNTTFTKIAVQALSMVALAMTLVVTAPTEVAAGNKTISNGNKACNVVTPRGVVRKLCQANVRIYYCAGYEAGRLIYKNAPRSKQCPKGFSLKRR